MKDLEFDAQVQSAASKARSAQNFLFLKGKRGILLDIAINLY